MELFVATVLAFASGFTAGRVSRREAPETSKNVTGPIIKKVETVLVSCRVCGLERKRTGRFVELCTYCKSSSFMDARKA